MQNGHKKRIRSIAFYLPQFHPVPENDLWWGKGFTEWTNVTRAQPLFADHYQPHLPADLGFYDLRLPEVREAQAALAAEHGLDGFCYYHYWFKGRRLLERPFEEVLSSMKPDFPFCLCWANENWTRVWDGEQREILMQQEYGPEDDLGHIRWLARAFADSRYIRVNGKPLFAVFRAGNLPDPIATTHIWRREARRLGVGELFLCKVESGVREHGNPTEMGFDAAIEFQPDWASMGSPQRKGKLWRGIHRLFPLKKNRAHRSHMIYDYRSIAQKMLQRPTPTYQRFPCVTPAWDNSARRSTGAAILKNSSPQAYESWLKSVKNRYEASDDSADKLIFINAWNEWAEGNHLEPCRRWGRAYLEATRNALS